MSYGRVSKAFWHDDVIRALTEPARYFMLYLMSCPHGNRLGLFVLDPGYAASDLDGWEPSQVLEALTELRDAGRILWDRSNRVVFVRYYLRHNTLVNQSVVKGALNDLRALPTTPLLGDLLDTVIAEQKGPAGPILSHYRELEDALRRRAGATRENGVNTKESHNDPHSAGHNDPHSAGHNRRARARAPSLTVPTPTSPSPPDPPRSGPGPAGRGEHGGENREDVEALETEIRRNLDRARSNIVAIHGDTEEPIEIEGHVVGVGLDIEAYRATCRLGHDPPHIVASAIAFIPDVTGLDPPMSLARWGAEKDGPAIYELCVGLAYKHEPSVMTAVGLKPLAELEAMDAEAAKAREERRKLLRDQVAQLKEANP